MLVFLAASAFLQIGGCVSSDGNSRPKEHSSDASKELLPVILLPLVDFQRPAETTQMTGPATLEIDTTSSPEFLIRFEGRRNEGSKHEMALVYIRLKRANRMVTTASCFLFPKGDLSADTAIYEGDCEMPTSPGPSIVEVKSRGKSILVLPINVK